MRRNSSPGKPTNTIPYFWRGVGQFYRGQPFIYLLLLVYVLHESIFTQNFYANILFWLILFIVIGMYLLWVHHLNTRYLSIATQIFWLKATAIILAVKRLYETRKKQGVEHYMLNYEPEVRPKELPPFKATGTKKIPFFAVNHLKPGHRYFYQVLTS